MFFAELGQVLLRRWYLLLVGVLCAVGAGFVTFQAVPPGYTASAEVLLLPPDPTVPEDGNPYLSLSGLTPAGDVLARALSDPQAADEIAASGGPGSTPLPWTVIRQHRLSSWRPRRRHRRTP